MGQRGPAPKPVELKALEGGRGNRPLDLTATFRPEVGTPPLPRDLSREGKKAWKRLVPELLHYNLLSKVDADALEELCETIGLLKVLRRSINAAQERLLAEGKDPAAAIEGSTPNGMKVQSVTYQAMNREREKLRSMLGEFGLTPAQRARVATAIRSQMPLSLVPKGPQLPGMETTPPAEPTGFDAFPD
jgi:P27 family predicted phage terminase small subunit